MDFINFTDPYYDELLYSALTRYYQESSEIPFYQARMELYGKECPGRPRVYLASNLKSLTQNLGPSYSVESILMNHTVFPYYRPFLTKEKGDMVIASTEGNESNTFRSLGINSSHYEYFRYLRYCP